MLAWCQWRISQMKNVHQNIKSVLSSGVKQLSCVSSDFNALTDLQRRIEHCQGTFKDSQIRLLQFSAQKELKITPQAQKTSSTVQLQNLQLLVERYSKAGAQLIEGMLRLNPSLKIQNQARQPQPAKSNSQPQNIIKDSLLSESNEDSDGLHIDWEDLQMPTDYQLLKGESANQRNSSTGVERSGKVGFNFRLLPNKDESSDSTQSVQNQTPNRKKIGLSGQILDDLYADLKMPNLNKKQIQKKYSISESTVNRYIRRLKQNQQLPQYLQKRVLKQKLNPAAQANVARHNRLSAGFVQRITNRRKNSKMKLIEPRLKEIYTKYPQIYQAEAAAMLSTYYKQQISIHVVSRCLKNLEKQKNQLQSFQKKDVSKKMEKVDQQNSPENIKARHHFAKQTLSRSQQDIIFIGQGVYLRQQAATKRPDIYIALALAGNGRIVHWKVKCQPFNPAQIAMVVMQVSQKFQDHTFVLGNSQSHHIARIVNRNRVKRINYLAVHMPLQINPVNNIIWCFTQELKKKKDIIDMQPKEALHFAHQTIICIKDRSFKKEIEILMQYLKTTLNHQ